MPAALQPRNYFVYTPLLPAMCAGTVEERSIVEPVRAVMGTKVRGCPRTAVWSGHVAGGEQKQRQQQQPLLQVSGSPIHPAHSTRPA
jgi:hypothetical protein